MYNPAETVCIAGLKNKADVKSVFNLKDNFVYADADKLYDAGVDSLKIEGRIKSFSMYTM